MQMALIPPYFVYDGFENGLDSEIILERIMSVSSTTSNMFTHLQYILRACLTSNNAGYNKPYVGSNEIISATSMAERRWEKEKNSKYFPALAQQTALASTVSTLLQRQDILALITAIKETTTTTPTTPSSSTEDDNQD